MKSLFAVLLAACLYVQADAQDKTYASTPGIPMFSMTDDRISVLPCRPDMIICDLDRELERTEARPLADIRETLRESLSDAVAEQCMLFAYGSVHPPVTENREGYQQLFGHAAYQELPVPKSQDNAGRLAKVRALLEAGDSNTPSSARVHQGEIQTFIDKEETFMQLTLRHDSALNTLQEQTQFDYLVCINELDIRVLRIHEMEMGQAWDRRVKVHYTIFDPAGNTVAGGAAYSTYPGTEKGLDILIREQFPKVAAQIAADMVRIDSEVTSEPQPVPTKTKKARRGTSDRGSDDDF